MILSRGMVILPAALAVLPAIAQPGLTAFVEANGCKMLVAERSVERLREIAAQGSIAWSGKCRNGLISGPGVVREEGSVTVGGKLKKFAYFLSGEARNGIRAGEWRRETFDRFADSPRFYTSAATISFAGGKIKGQPRLLAIASLDQLTPAFRKFVIDAQHDAAPANTALLAAATPAPQPIPQPTLQPVPPPAPQSAAKPVPQPTTLTSPPPPAKTAPPAPSRPAPQPRTAPAPTPRFTASSQLEKFGPEGLSESAQPGWHSASPPSFPEWVMVDLRAPRLITTLGLLPQDGHLERAPGVIRIESSNDGKQWSFVALAENSCLPSKADTWAKIKFPQPASGRYFRLSILSNCGDPDLVTIRGVTLE